MWVNLIFIVSSWCALRRARGCPPAFRAGRPLTDVQQRTASRVMGLVMAMACPRSPGCAGGKLEALLPTLDAAVLAAELGPEAGPLLGRGDPAPLRSDRVKFEVGSDAFDPVEHLGFFAAATYLEPRILLGRRPAAPPPRMLQRSKDQVLALARRWDAADRLELFRTADVPKAERACLIAVHKDENYDRLIVDRRPRNAKEAHLCRGSQTLTPGWRLTDIILEESESLQLYSSDLREMFYSFWVSSERAETNCIAADFPARSFEGSTALRRLERRLGPLPRCQLPPASLFPRFRPSVARPRCAWSSAAGPLAAQ